MHQFGTLQRLLDFYDEFYNNKMCKAVVWAHNSHIGDARATKQGRQGELNIGQLARLHYGMDQVVNIGFTTYNGSVTAANNWDEDPHFMKVKPGMEGSFEEVFHRTVEMAGKALPERRFALIFRSNKDKSNVVDQTVSKELGRPLEERYIGVIYRPRTENVSHYITSEIAKQYDIVIHIDTTKALRPLEIHPQWEKGEREHVPDTFPFEM
jgi:erythromycin esterase-like protein